MKKLLIILTLLVAFLVSCSSDKDNSGDVGTQTISLSNDAFILDADGNISEGAQKTLIVTSTDDWTLTGDLSWCTPSVTKGSTGATVTFAAKKNNTGEYREINLFFICGDAAKKFTVKQFPEGVVQFDNLSDTYKMSNTGGRMTVKVNTNLDIFNTEISEDWVSIRAEKDDSKTKWVQFVLDENKTFYDRSVKITMFKGTDFEKSFNITQNKFTGVMITGTSDYEFGKEGGKVTVSLMSNSNFMPSLSTASASWLSVVEISSSGTDVITKTFEITCSAGEWTRYEVIKFSPISSGVSATLNISQVNSNPELFDVPDKVFAKYLVSLKYIVAKDNKYYLTYSGHTATSLSFSSKAYALLESLEGIEHFPNLASLSLVALNIRKLDLSKNIKIESLSMAYMPLEELILGDTNLESLSIYLQYNYFYTTSKARSFAVSSTKLASLSILPDPERKSSTKDEVEWIDITKCPALTSLDCTLLSSGKLKAIYMTASQKLAYDSGKLKIVASDKFDKVTGITVK